jgi:hypothetical protein
MVLAAGSSLFLLFQAATDFTCWKLVFDDLESCEGARLNMARPTTFPPGSWPLEMRAPTAAAYCDEPSVDAFLAKVERGIYPQPARHPGCAPKWHRAKLDRDIARRHNIDDLIVVEDVTGLI